MPERVHVLLPKSAYARIGTLRASKALVHDHRNNEILSRRCKSAQYSVLESQSSFVDWGLQEAHELYEEYMRNDRKLTRQAVNSILRLWY